MKGYLRTNGLVFREVNLWYDWFMIDTVRMTFDLPRNIFSALRQDPDQFVREMRLAAAVKWYETRQVSQSRAAEIAGISRSEFLAALVRFNVSPFQISAEELLQEVLDA